jgi:hypothetical protein
MPSLRDHLIELDQLVRDARDRVMIDGADPARVALLEALFAVGAQHDQYERLCAEAGLDVGQTDEPNPVMSRLMAEIGVEIVRPNMDDETFARYGTLVMARAAAEDADVRLAALGVAAQQVLGTNPFADLL